MTKLKYKLMHLLVGMSLPLFCESPVYITSNEVISRELATGAVIRGEPGFETDFLVLHCLVKKYQPKKLFEVGTCQGYGTLIIANAYPNCTIISLDLPPHTPPFNLKLSDIGRMCKGRYQQVFGDSLTYNYALHFPIDAWFIDGAHDYQHVNHETEQAVQSGATLIVYHDTDIPEVLQAVIDALQGSEYKIYRITDTRVSYAIK